jgi:hypothetical protein
MNLLSTLMTKRVTYYAVEKRGFEQLRFREHAFGMDDAVHAWWQYLTAPVAAFHCSGWWHNFAPSGRIVSVPEIFLPGSERLELH